jgi:hypothetical protein
LEHCIDTEWLTLNITNRFLRLRRQVSRTSGEASTNPSRSTIPPNQSINEVHLSIKKRLFEIAKMDILNAKSHALRDEFELHE